ncbi:MAG: hypothetical protein DRJ60_07630 [Thermoprotei archaeon]|nr:MAG: hypothetical protein DRJ60_07630 [Thermoprotei archaeon]
MTSSGEEVMQLLAIKDPTLSTICKRAASNVAKRLSALLNRNVKYTFTGISIIPLENLYNAVDGGDVYVNFVSTLEGAIKGLVLLLIPYGSMTEIMKHLLEGLCPNSNDREIKLSLVQELGNIIIGGFISEIANYMNSTIFYSIPSPIIDLPRAFLDAVISLLAPLDFVIMINATIEDYTSSLQVHIVLLPGDGSAIPQTGESLQ